MRCPRCHGRGSCTECDGLGAVTCRACDGLGLRGLPRERHGELSAL